jgi:2-dehydropantoate 2-reductase
MKVCIYGAGAIGGLIGARLAAAGRATVSVIARGATLEAVRRHGMRLQQGGADLQVPVVATDDPQALGPQDLVVVAVKTPALSGVAARIGPLLAPATVVLPAMNGLPWWFFDALPGPLMGTRLETMDPDGTIGRAIPTGHVIGCVVHAAASMPSPGLVRHGMGDHLIVGEPDGSSSTRLVELAALLSHAGFEVACSARIQNDIWYKLWGNLTMNPVSALTGATADRILDDPLVRDFCSAVMAEAAEIGARFGCNVTQTPEERHAVTRKLGAMKTSMLQDVEAGKPIELDAIVGAVREIGARVGVATPSINALFGLARLFGAVRGLYGGCGGSDFGGGSQAAAREAR